MSSLIKYRVHEVAKDFNRSTKEITDILTKYATTPKNHMQVLEDRELSIIFDYLTQHNQVQSIESIYADTYHEPKPAQKPAGQAGGRQPQGQNGGQKQQAPQNSQKQQGGGKPPRPQQAQPAQGQGNSGQKQQAPQNGGRSGNNGGGSSAPQR